MLATASMFQENELVSGGARLWWGMTLPGERVRAEVVLTHGLGEHAGRYEHVAARFAARGIRTIAYDLRGHGRSAGPRGDSPSYETLLDDLGRVFGTCPRGEGPVFLMGHSLGGQITLNFLLRREAVCRGAIVLSPWLRLAFSPQWWRVLLGKMLVRWWPSYSQPTPGDQLRLSRDAKHLASLAGQELMHHRISTRLYFAIEQAGREALAQAKNLRAPILLLHGAADEVTSPAATQEFFDTLSVEDKRLVLLPEALHETHNDLCREQMLDEVLEWVERRLD